MSDKESDHVDTIIEQVDQINIDKNEPTPSTSTATGTNTAGKRKLSDPDNRLEPSPKSNKKLVPVKLEPVFRCLHKLLEKAGRYKQHLEYLTKYLAKNKIPLGLQCRVTPSFGKHDPTFTSRWQKICDDGSLRLLELSIERVSSEYDTLMTAAINKKQELYDTAENKSEADTVFTFIQQIVQRRVDSLKKVKDQKLEADLTGKKRGKGPGRWRFNRNQPPTKTGRASQRQFFNQLTKFMDQMDTCP